MVNGARWGARSEGRLLLPAGNWKVERCEGGAEVQLKDFNGELLGLERVGGRLRVEYESRTRAIAILPGEPERVVMLEPGRRQEWLE